MSATSTHDTAEQRQRPTVDLRTLLADISELSPDVVDVALAVELFIRLGGVAAREDEIRELHDRLCDVGVIRRAVNVEDKMRFNPITLHFDRSIERLDLLHESQHLFSAVAAQT